MALENSAAKAAEQFEKIRSMYQQKVPTLNALIYGEWGCGKTSLLRTAPKPVLLDSFDPGGAKVLREHVDRGEILVRDWSAEDSDNPTEYIKWERQFEADSKSGLFDHVATYAIDSLTTMIQAMLNYCAKKSALPDNIPSPREYLVVGKTLGDIVKRMADKKCHFVMLAHMEYDKDEYIGKILANIRGFKSVKADLPILFDEKLYLRSVSKPSGTEYELLTQTQGLYKASTRLGADGKFAAIMPADIRNLLKVAGLPYEDKPLMKGGTTS